MLFLAGAVVFPARGAAQETACRRTQCGRAGRPIDSIAIGRSWLENILHCWALPYFRGLGIMASALMPCRKSVISEGERASSIWTTAVIALRRSYFNLAGG